MEDKVHLAQMATPIVAFCAFLLAICSAYIALRTYKRSADFTAVMDIWKAVREERARFQSVAEKQPRIDKDYYHACTHFFNQLELVAYSINNGLIGKRGTAYLKPWLTNELQHIYGSKTQGRVFVLHVFDISNPKAYPEMLKICPISLEQFMALADTSLYV